VLTWSSIRCLKLLQSLYMTGGRSLEGSALKDERNLATKEAGKFALLESESVGRCLVITTQVPFFKHSSWRCM
jgi:hypothetical protein